MRRLLLPLLAAAALGACSEPDTNPSAANLVGTYDMVLSGERLFVIAADRDELRVVDTTPLPGEGTDFVRAPNPLEALSIPVLARPSALTADRLYVDGTKVPSEGSARYGGRVLPGPYVYARSTGARTVSVVLNDQKIVNREPPEGTLAEDLPKMVRAADLVAPNAQAGEAGDPAYARRLQKVADLEAPGPVTAFAAQATFVPGSLRTSSVLYVATQDGTSAKLWRAVMPAPECYAQPQPEGLGCTAGNPVSFAEVTVSGAFLTDASVTSLVAMPATGKLAFATRAKAGRAGTAGVLDIATGGVTELKFGSTVRQLATHAEVRTTRLDGTPGTVLRPAGQLVFGVLDESACAVVAECSGIVAVDSTTGERAVYPSTSTPMLPLQLTTGLVTSLVLETSVAAIDFRPEDFKKPETAQAFSNPFQLLGMATTSTGQVVFFDGQTLEHLDQDPYGPLTSAGRLYDRSGRLKEALEIPVTNIEVADGKALQETVSLAYQGELPGLAEGDRRAVATSGAPFVAPPDVLARAAVAAGDTVSLFRLSGTTVEFCKLATGADVDLRVTGVDSASGVVSTDPAAVPETCAGYGFFVVRAGGTRALVVTGTGSGFMGRTSFQGAPDSKFEFDGTVRWRSRSNPDAAGKKYLSITLPSQPANIARDDHYLIDIDPRFLPYNFSVRYTVRGDTLRLPLAANFFYGSGDTYYGRLYLADPSIRAVSEVDLSLVSPTLSLADGRTFF